MRADRAGVAGFFEDLPVLLFVLSGVAALVLTSAFVSERMATSRMDVELDKLALSVVDSVSSEMLYLRGPDILPTVDSIRSSNWSSMVGQLVGGRGYAVSVSSIYPSSERLLSIWSDLTGSARSTGYASRLVNALDNDGLCVVVEVRAVVW